MSPNNTIDPNTQKAKAAEKKPKQEEPQEPIEESVELRAVVCIMITTCIVVTCLFVKTQPLMILLYAIFGVGGSYLSYEFRDRKSLWVKSIVLVGALLVVANFGRELLFMYDTGQFEILTPLVHQLAGLLVLHSFELRSRSDLNVSAGLGLALLCLAAPVSKSLLYGICIAVYICMGAIMLYYDCVSRSLHSWLTKPMQAAALNTTGRGPRTRRTTGSILATLAFLPLLSLAFFLFVPRIDNFYDLALAAYRAWSAKMQGNMTDLKPEDLRSPADNQIRKYEPPKEPLESKDPETNKAQQAEPNSKGAPQHKDPKGMKAKAAAQEKAKKDKKQSDKGKAKSKDKDKSKDKSEKDKEGGAKIGSKDGKEKKNDGKTEKGSDKGKEENRNPMGEGGVDLSLRAKVTDELLFKVACNRELYIRRVCFDTFTGAGWKEGEEGKEPTEYKKPQKGPYDLSLAPAFMVPKNFPAVDVEQEYTICGDLGYTLFSAWVPQKINPDSKFPVKSIVVDKNGVVKSSTKLTKDMKYKVNSLVPVFDLDSMRRLSSLSPGKEDQVREELKQYLQLPDNHSIEVTELAEKVIGDQGNWFVQCERICDHLRETYKYTTDRPELPENDNLVRRFLVDTKQGDCEEFASSFVIMSRCVGIPARCVGGFSPGQFNEVTGEREVRTKHSHAWGEAFIPGFGWVPFDATPGGEMPSHRANTESYSIESLGKKIREQITGQKDDKPLTSEEMKRKALDLAIWGGGTIFTTVFLILLFRYMLAAYKRWKKKMDSIHPASKIYARVIKDLKRWKVNKMPADTASDLHLRVRAAMEERQRDGQTVDRSLPDVVAQFGDKYSAVYFGEKEGLKDLEHMSQEIRRLVSASKK